MTYGPPPGSPADQPGGGYGPQQGGQPGTYGPPQGGQPGAYGPPQGGQPGAYGPPQGGQPGAYGPPQGGQPGAYGPPQGGYGTPPQYGAQPGGPQHGGQYGGSPYGAGSTKPGFDAKSVNPLDWAALGLPVLALIFSFFSYYDYSPKGSCDSSVGGNLCDGIGNSAWHGFFGWFAILLALIAAALIAIELFAPQAKLPVPARLAALGALVLSVIFTLLALLIIPDGSYKGLTIPSDSSEVDAGVDWSYWIVLILLIAAAVVTFLRFQQTGGKLSDLGGSKSRQPAGSGFGAPGQTGYGAPTYAAPGQQPGYVPPPPPQGYQPPPPPPGGYQPTRQQPAAGYQPPQQGYQPPQQGYGQQPGSQAPPPQGYQPEPPPGNYQPPAGSYQQQPPQGPPAAQPPAPQTPPPAAPPAPGSTGSTGEPDQPSADHPSQS
jgi:hypothetical protein